MERVAGFEAACAAGRSAVESWRPAARGDSRGRGDVEQGAARASGARIQPGTAADSQGGAPRSGASRPHALSPETQIGPLPEPDND